MTFGVPLMCADALEALDHLVEPVAAAYQVVDEAVGGVDVAAQARALLGEVAELVGEDRFELAQAEDVDQAQADEQVLAGGPEQAGDAGVRHDGGVDLVRDVNLARQGGAGLLAQPFDEVEQQRLVVGRDLDADGALLLAALEEALDQEQEEKHGRNGDERSRRTGMTTGARTATASEPRVRKTYRPKAKMRLSRTRKTRVLYSPVGSARSSGTFLGLGG